MIEKPNFFYKVENTGEVKHLDDEFKLAFTSEATLPQLRNLKSEK